MIPQEDLPARPVTPQYTPQDAPGPVLLPCYLCGVPVPPLLPPPTRYEADPLPICPPEGNGACLDRQRDQAVREAVERAAVEAAAEVPAEAPEPVPVAAKPVRRRTPGARKAALDAAEEKPA